MKKIIEDIGVGIILKGRWLHADLVYADNIVLINNCLREMHAVLSSLIREREKVGFGKNSKKNEITINMNMQTSCRLLN